MKLTEMKCCWKLKCKKEVKYWVRKMEKSLYHEIPYRSTWWHPLCSKHLKKIIKNPKFEIIALKTERVRKFEHKIFCGRDLDIKKHKNWKMFIDWEEVIEVLDLDTPPFIFDVYRALQKHYYNNYLKIKKRLGVLASKSTPEQIFDNIEKDLYERESKTHQPKPNGQKKIMDFIYKNNTYDFNYCVRCKKPRKLDRTLTADDLRNIGCNIKGDWAHLPVCYFCYHDHQNYKSRGVNK